MSGAVSSILAEDTFDLNQNKSPIGGMVIDPWQDNFNTS
jgi:hypothetical protein